MPTIKHIDSFQHRCLVTGPSANLSAFYDSISRGGTLPNHGSTGITFDTAIKRTSDHACSLKIVEDGVTATNVRRAYDAQFMVGSFYFRIDAAPSVTSKMFNISGAGSTIHIGMDTTGHIYAKVGTGTTQTSSGTYADSTWHRLDFKALTNTGTATLDVQVDGTAITQATLVVAAANMTNYMCGSNQAVDTLTCYYSDLVISQTSADYPLGDHICLKLEIAGTGTHNKGAGAWTDHLGATTDAALLAAVDDAWDGTTPELSQTGEDYDAQTANDGTSYLEFTIATVVPPISAVWGAGLAVLMAALDATTANNGNTKLVDSGGASVGETGLIDPSISSTAYTGYRPDAGLASPSGGWSETSLEACKVRIGFSTDAAPDVIFNSAIVEYAAVLGTPTNPLQIMQEIPFIQNINHMSPI